MTSSKRIFRFRVYFLQKSFISIVLCSYSNSFWNFATVSKCFMLLMLQKAFLFLMQWQILLCYLYNNSYYIFFIFKFCMVGKELIYLSQLIKLTTRKHQWLPITSWFCPHIFFSRNNIFFKYMIPFVSVI
jgi:hypothetical protein